MTEIVTGSLRMYGDHLLVSPLEWDASKIIEAIRHGRPVRGIVRAVGPGRNQICKRKNLGDGRRSFEYSKWFQPTEIKVGETISWGGLNIFDGKGYHFPEVIVNGERCIVCTERDVCLVEDDGPTE